MRICGGKKIYLANGLSYIINSSLVVNKKKLLFLELDPQTPFTNLNILYPFGKLVPESSLAAEFFHQILILDIALPSTGQGDSTQAHPAYGYNWPIVFETKCDAEKQPQCFPAEDRKIFIHRF